MANKENAVQGSAGSDSPQDSKTEAEFRKVTAGLKALVGLLDKPLPLNVDAVDELQLGLRRLSRALKKACGVEIAISENPEVDNT